MSQPAPTQALKSPKSQALKSPGDSGYCFIKYLKELVLDIWGGAERWRIDAEDVGETCRC